MQIENPELQAALAEVEVILTEMEDLQQSLASLDQSISKTSKSMFKGAVGLARAGGTFSGGGLAATLALDAAGVLAVGALAVKGIGYFYTKWKEEAELAALLPKKQEVARIKQESLDSFIPRLSKTAERFEAIVFRSAAEMIDGTKMDRFEVNERALESAMRGRARTQYAMEFCRWASSEFAAWRRGEHTSGTAIPSTEKVVDWCYGTMLASVFTSCEVSDRIGDPLPLGAVYILRIKDASKELRKSARYERCLMAVSYRKFWSWLLAPVNRARQERQFQSQLFADSRTVIRRSRAMLALVAIPVCLATAKFGFSPTRGNTTERQQIDSSTSALESTAIDSCGDPSNCFRQGMRLLDDDTNVEATRKARLFLARACDSTHQSACVALADMQCRGIGGPQDPAEANINFRRSCSLGASAQCERTCNSP